MGYTPVVINNGDPADASWANKVEQHLGRIGSFQGVVADVANLPDPSTKDENDWYVVLSQRSIYAVQSGKWKRFASLSGSIAATKKIEIFETAGAYEGLYYSDIAFSDKGPNNLEVVARITANLGQNHKLRLSIGSDTAETVFNTGTDQVVSVALSPTVTPPIIETAQIDMLINYDVVGDIPSGMIDGSNKNFQLSQHPILPNSVTIHVDESITITDDGNGNLSDGGSINYGTGAIFLNTAPTTSLTADYTAGKVQDEIPTGTIDGSNKTFTVSNTYILPASVTVTVDGTDYYDDTEGNLIKEIADEIPSGTVDGSNKNFTLAYPVKAGTLTLTVDGTDYNDDSNGNIFKDITGDTPTGMIDGTNKLFTLNNVPVKAGTVKVNIDGTEYTENENGEFIKDVSGETPSGTIDGSNKAFTLAGVYVIPGSVVLTIDGATKVYDNGKGDLTDGGTIDYDAGTITLGTAPASSLSVDYSFVLGKVVDHTTGILYFNVAPSTSLSADYTFTLATIDYTTGAITFTQAPTTSLSADYEGTNGTIDYETGDIMFINAPSTSVTVDYEIKCGYLDFLELRWY